MAARIVVGIDGSENAKPALRWALDEARLRGAPLRVVYAWMPPAYAAGYGLVPGALVDSVALGAIAKEELDKAIDSIVSDAKDVSIERVAVEGVAASVLVDQADEADLLVVGSRGHGGFAVLLLGSVSQQCAHHAPCPLVIVRAGDA